jgi:hypothetical protein
VPDVNGNCSSGTIFDPNSPVAGQFTGSGIQGDGINLAYGMLPDTGAAICRTGGWAPMTVPSPPGSFDGITLESFTSGPSGFVKMTIYLRNDFYVQTSASQTNNIAICTGVRHTAGSQPGLPFMGRNGIAAVWDPVTQDWWGVLARVPNCNKSPDVNNDGVLDPVLCAWGTVTLGDGLSYRSATVLIPYDWDIKMGY